MRAIITQKIEMTHVFDQNGNFIPVTLLWAGDNVVTQVKSAEKDGYEAIQIGAGTKKKISKPNAGHLAKAGSTSRKLLEVCGEDGKSYQVGEKLSVTIFEEGDMVKAQGVSKGKGFAGTIKRHNFHRGPKTHGSHNYRAPGSIGAGFPQHVQKGQKLPGRMGNAQITLKNIKVVRVIPDENIVLVKGSVPGPKKSFVLLTAQDKLKDAA